MAQTRSIFVDSALSIIKGAACIVFQIPVGKTTKSVSFKANHTGTLSLGKITKPPTPEQEDHLKFLIDNKISEDAKFSSFLVPRETAERLYGNSMYDVFKVPDHVQSLRITILEEWNINCNAYPVLKSTSYLGKIEISQLKFLKSKEQLDIKFQVHPNNDEISSYPICVNQEVHEEKLPHISQVLPHNGIEDSYVQIKTTSEQTINPWKAESSTGSIDYQKIINTFGCSAINDSIIQRLEKLSGKRAHTFLRRKIFFSHRDLDLILDSYEKGYPFYLYTGRGPSSESLHLGHMIPFMLTQYLQEVFGVLVVIQMTDDEKFLFKEELNLKDVRKHAYENAKDIIACGFDKDKTFIFSDIDYIKELYPTVLEIQKRVTFNQSKGIFGFNESDNIGKISFAAIQAAPSFSSAFPKFFKGKPNIRCLIPQAIDQDPYFRMTRDVAPRMKELKPSLIHSIFFPSLQGFSSKMSASIDTSAIFMSDSPKDITKKVKNHAFSGGRQTFREHREKGADLSVDVPYHYLKFFLDDDDEFETIGKKYSSGEMLTIEVKEILIRELNKIVQAHQERRKNLTKEDVEFFMNPNRSTLTI